MIKRILKVFFLLRIVKVDNIKLFDKMESMIKEYQILIGLLVIALAIYLGLTNSYGNIVNVSAKTEMDSCMELSTEFFGDEAEARKYCISAFAN